MGQRWAEAEWAESCQFPGQHNAVLVLSSPSALLPGFLRDVFEMHLCENSLLGAKYIQIIKLSIKFIRHLSCVCACVLLYFSPALSRSEAFLSPSFYLVI